MKTKCFTGEFWGWKFKYGKKWHYGTFDELITILKERQNGTTRTER